MRRCQRLPELRTPLIPRDTNYYIKRRTCAIRGIRWKLLAKMHAPAGTRPVLGTGLTSRLDETPGEMLWIREVYEE